MASIEKSELECYISQNSIWLTDGLVDTGKTELEISDELIDSLVDNSGDITTIYIETHAFYTKLTSIKITTSREVVIRQAAFAKTLLNSLEINSNTELDFGALQFCHELTTISGLDLSEHNIGYFFGINNSRNYKQQLAKYKIANLYDINSTLTDRCCAELSSLINISFTEIPEIIPFEAFTNCTKLATFNISSDKDKYETLLDLTEVSIIKENAFKNCLGFKIIWAKQDEQETFELIESGAFNGCTNLQTIYKKDTLPLQEGSTTFGCMALYAKTILNFSLLGASLGKADVLSATETPGIFKQKLATGNFLYIFDNINKLPTNIYNSNNEILDLVDITAKLGIQDNDQLSIPDNSFQNNTILKCVIFPKQLNYLGTNSFKNCSKLETIKFNLKKNNFIEFGANCFDGCSILTNLYLESGSTAQWIKNTFNYPQVMLKNIKYFYCNNYVGIKTCVTCETTGIDTTWKDKTTTTLTISSGDMQEDELSDTITSCAFMHGSFFKRLEDETGKIINISDYAFYGCLGLTDYSDIILHSSSETPIVFAPTAFEATALAALSVYQDGDFLVQQYLNKTEVVRLLNPNTTTVTINDNHKCFGADVFKDCPNLKYVKFAGSIKDWLALEFATASSNPLSNTKATLFTNDSNQFDWTSLTISADYTIKAYTLINQSIERLIIVNTPTIFTNAFYNCGKIDMLVADPAVLSKISSYLPKSKIYKIQLNEGDSELPARLFKGFSALQSVNIPGSITKIGADAFKDCTSLTHVHYDGPWGWGENEVYAWGNIEFINQYSHPCCNANVRLTAGGVVLNELESINRSAIDTKIRPYTYLNFNKLKQFKFNDSNIDSFSSDAFIGCTNLKDIRIEHTDDYNRKYIAVSLIHNYDNDLEYLCNKANGTTMSCINTYILDVRTANQKKVKLVYATSGKVLIDPKQMAKDLDSYTEYLSDDILLTIDKDAFRNSKLISFKINNKTNVYFGKGCFANQSELTNLVIPFLGPCAATNPNFDTNNVRLTYLFRPTDDNLTTLSRTDSTGNTAKLDLTLTGDDIRLYNHTFKGCKLNNLYISGKLTYFEPDCLDDGTTAADGRRPLITKQDQAIQAQGLYFSGIANSADTDAELVILLQMGMLRNSECKHLDFNEIKGLSNLQYIYKDTTNELALDIPLVLPDTLIGICSSAFRNTEFQEIVFPKSLTYVGANAFTNCATRTLEINSDLTKFTASQDNKPLHIISNFVHTIAVSESVTSITAPMDWFVAYTKANVVRDNITTIRMTTGGDIPNNALQNWPHLKTVYFNKPITSIGDNAFAYCSSLVNFEWDKLNDTCTSIGDYAFRGCSSLRSAKIPKKIGLCFNYKEQYLSNKVAFAMCSNFLVFKAPETGYYTFITDSGVVINYTINLDTIKQFIEDVVTGESLAEAIKINNVLDNPIYLEKDDVIYFTVRQLPESELNSTLSEKLYISFVDNNGEPKNINVVLCDMLEFAKEAYAYSIDALCWLVEKIYDTAPAIYRFTTSTANDVIDSHQINYANITTKTTTLHWVTSPSKNKYFVCAPNISKTAFVGTNLKDKIDTQGSSYDFKFQFNE